MNQGNKYGIFFISAWALLTLIGAVSSHADLRKIEKLRSFYREHNLDFFGDLITDQNDGLADETRLAKLELLADDARTKALDQLERLLKTARGAMQAELLIRKASLMSDRARTATYFQNNPLKSSRLKHPQHYLEQSIKTFLVVEHDHNTHPKMDIVIFSIAYNYGELKKHDDAFRYYGKLVQKFGDSPLVGDARLAMSEILFDKRKFADSLAQLREIVKSEHPRLKNFALYKMAWTYYNMGDLASSIHSLEKVIDGVNQASGIQRARLELRKEALHDLVVFYAESPEMQPAAASEYFTRVAATPSAIAADIAEARAKRLASLLEKKAIVSDEETDAYQLNEAQELLFRLTQVYRDQGKHQNAMVAAELIINKLPRHPRSVALYRLRAESAEKLRRRDLVLIELERLAKIVEADLPAVKDYRDGLPAAEIPSMGEYFAGQKIADIKKDQPQTKPAKLPALIVWEKLETADDYYRRNLSRVALETFKDFTNFFHGEWMKTNSNETALHAATAYDTAIRALLTPWRGHELKDCFELRYRRAQLRYALKHWDAAAADYAWLSVRRAQDRDDILRGEIAALEGWIKASPIAIKSGSSTLHPVHERLNAAYDRFLAFNVVNEKLREIAASVLSASARMHSDYGKTEQALKRMIFYSRFFHDAKDAVARTRDVLVALEKAARWEDLRDYSESLLETGHYKALSVTKDLTQAQQFAHLKLLEKLEKEQDWKSAAKEFASFAVKHSESPFASQALMKAANAALQLKDAELSVKKLEAATQANDESVRLQAWLGLEPFYRKAFLWKKLTGLYNAVLKLKSDAKTREGAQKNLNAITELDAARFYTGGANMIAHDPDLDKLIAAQQAYERTTKEFMSLRFLKSNNNPASNFKRKAEMHANLSSAIDKVADSAPKTLRSGAALWANVIKAELLLEFSETLASAALPAALKGASEVDRKSYVDTIAAQAQELRQKALEFTDGAAEQIVKIDYPLNIEARLNGLLGKFERKYHYERPSFAKVWTERLHIKTATDANYDERVFELGLKTLSEEKKTGVDERLYDLAHYYAENGNHGYAHALSSHLATEASGDVAAQALRLLVMLELERLPESFKKAASSDQLDAKTRWNLARWFAAQASIAKKASDAFSEKERKWFDEAITTLLRPTQTEAMAIAPGRALSQTR